MPTRHAIVVLNLPVPDDRRVWAQAVALRDAGVAPIVLCPAIRGRPAGRHLVDGIDVHRFRSFEGKHLLASVLEAAWNTARVAGHLRALRRAGTTSLQVCNPPDTLAPVLAAARRRGIATVYDQHDLVPAMASARPGFAWLRRLFERFEAATVRHADLVLTTSIEQQERLRDRYGVDALVVRSAPHGETRAERVSNADDVVLGYVGDIGEADGLDELMRALVLARGAGAPVRVEIAGDGQYLPEVEQAVAELGLQDAVRFHGWLQGDELERMLRGIDAMVVSDPESEYNHHCAMNKVIEAMARGLPIVMRPLRENVRLAGDAPWVARGWSDADLADAIVAFASADRSAREAESARLVARYESEVAWSQHRRRYVDAITEVRACASERARCRR